MRTRKKRAADMPPRVNFFIDSVISTPLENIEAPLSHFDWDYGKGDFHHWVDLFNHFNSFFDKHVKTRKDLQLDGDFLESDTPFPKQAVLQILRVTRIILDNCANKYLYSAQEHLALLLASTDVEITVAALQTLAALVKKPTHSNRTVRWHGDPTMNEKLFSLSQGWGGKEEGLGLVACSIEDGCGADACLLGSTLHFEFYADADVSVGNFEAKNQQGMSGLQVIHIPEVHLNPKSDLELLKHLCDTYQVPLRLRFSLLTRLRFARAFHSVVTRRYYLCIRLLAFTVLLQSNPDHEDLAAFFVNEPEFVNELVTLLQSEENVPENIRILAIRALAALAQDRPRQSNVLSVVSAGGHRGILPGLVQKAVVSMTSGVHDCSVAFVESLLGLVTILVSSSSGSSALREAGLIPTLLPLLKYNNPHHVDLVASAVHILEAFMDYSNPAGTLFRDLGGLDDAVARLHYEVIRVKEAGGEQCEDMDTSVKGKSVSVESNEHEKTVNHEPVRPYQQRILLKALLRAIALGTYSLDNASRLHGSEEDALPSCLSMIFKHAKKFGGGVFSLAASVMSDLINKDPTCFPALHAAGLPGAFLDSIIAGVLPSSDAVGCIPHALDALCLNQTGLQAVKDSNALHCFVDIFTSKAYVRALSGDTPGSVASGLDELMRHAPSLRDPGIDVCIKILNKIAVIGGMSEELSVPLPETCIVDTPTPMDTDLDENAVSPTKEESSSAAFFSSNEAAHENIETFLLECINNTVQLLETILQNSDTARVFIEKKGIEALLKLFTLPGLPINFGASLTACNMCSTFRAFSSQHAANLTKILCVTLRRHLEKTLENVGSVSNLKLLDLPNEVQKTVVQDLCALECFVAVAANLVRNLGPMLIELGNAGIDIITNIGKVHRWVLWQISAADDSKVDSKQDDEPENTGEENAGINGGSDVVNRESEENRDSANTSQYINPVSSVTSHSSHWSIEPEFLPLLQMEQGPGRRARRDHGTTAHILSHVARLGRLARHARVVRADNDGLGRPVNESRSQEHSKDKSFETLIYEMMPRLAGATRGLYIAMGKAMVVPSRRRDDSVTVTPAAKSVAAALAILIHDHLSFEGCGSSSGDTMSVKCKYLGKVIEDITAVVMDTRRRTCNTVMVNTLYAHGAIKEVLTTFAFACQVLWASACLMDSEATMEDSSKPGDKAIAPSWLLNTIQCYSRLLDCLVTSSLLLTPPAMGQLLVQSVTQGTIPIPKTPEALVLKMQAQVLEVVLPLWTHPMLAQTNVDLITAVSSVIMHIYSGVSDIKLQRGSGSGSTGARLIGPPPDESLISVIVEMGFSRSRAEEALRRVGTNSVEMAMEWLLNHPEEASQEEDELARALALSLGNGSGSGKEDDGTKVRQMMAEEVELQLPPIENMLSVCMNLLKSFDAVAFPLTDLLVTICTRNKGQDRSRIVIYLIEQITLCKLEESGSDFSPLSSVSHQLALLLNEDSLAREVAAGNGLVATVLGVLTDYVSAKTEGGREETPKWVATLLLVLDSMLQYRPKTGMDDEPSAKIQLEDGILDVSIPDSQQNAETRESISGKEHIKPWESILGKPSAYMTNDEQQRTMTLVCKLLQMKLPTTFMHAIFQLCARLTKVYSMAVQFLETGGLSALLSLPRSCLFPGFDSIAATIIRHLLEDPHTLQQAMESEIKHSLAATLNRHHGRVSPRTFLTLMASVILRDPAIFNQAVAAVCRIERIGDRPYVVLAKEKDKEKDREKEKAPDKEKAKTNTEEIHDITPSSNGCKVSESLPKTGKGHKKISPSFSHVVEQLLDVILHFAPSPEDECLHSKASISNFVTPMEIDDVACRDKGKAKLEENRLPEKNNMSETSASLAKVSFILKLMTEVVIMYSSAASVVLRRDAESSQGRGPIHAGSQAIGHGGLIYHVLHRLLPHSEDVGTKKLTLQEWTEKLSIKASNFLMAICVRSSEGRRRIFSEITKALTIASSKFETSSGEGSARPDKTVRSFVDFLNNVLSPQTSPGSIPAPGLSTEMAKAMLDVGLVHALTMILKEIDLDHPDTPKFVNGIVKVLEALTRVAASSVDQAVTSEGADTKKEVSGSEMLEVVGNDTSNGRSSDAGPQGILDVHSRDAVIGDSVQADLQIAIRAMQALVGDTSRYEHMDDHIRLGREAAVGVHLEVEEEFMQEADGVVGITVDFNMDHGGRDEEDEEEMDGDDGDEDEDDGEEEEDADNFEEEEEAHLSLPDTDVEDHELEDEYDEDMAEEEDDDDDDDDEDEDEDDDWRENRVIEVRWRDGLTGVSRVQVLGHTAEGNASDFPIDPFQGLSVEDLFGAFRRTSGSDQRRSSTYRPFFERTSSDHGRSFRHPLLTRPNLPTVAGSNGVTGNPLSNSSGTISRDTEVLLGGDMDVTHFYMYDGPILTGDTSNGIAESRVIASQNPSFFEFSLDPAHRFGRRRAQTDNRLSNWSDDGQPQGVAHAAAIAQALEENFIAQLGNLSSDEDRNSGQQNAVGDAPIGSTEREVIREVEGDASGRIEQASASDSHACRHVIESGCRSGPAMDGNVSSTSTDEHPEQVPNTDLDVPMHVHITDDRTEQVGRDVELASQDSSESGATVGESLRSLEVEIGSADGHDEGERHAGTDRLNAGEVPLREVLHRRMVIEDSGRQTDDMDDTDGARLATPQAERRVEISANLCNLSDSVPGGTDANDGLGGNGPVNMSSIDPAFLEALPEDLRAEVLASQQNQAATATDHQPSIEEIDPEFLAALPPEIQAEVLAQQQAQRLLQVQQMEGQPVDMDSASIIATFPEDLREEVLLTSSESVLAALPPALLAEAQLLRERAISQYNVRTLFGDGHRTGGRRNSTASGTRGTFTSIDRGVGSGSALTSGRRISSTHIDGSKGREADGKPLVDVAALKAMLRLLRLAQPLGKGLLQRLLLNLCAHNNTRVTLVQLLLDMLRPDVQGFPFLGSSADGAPPCRLYGCQWNVVYSRPQLSDGVPPLVSRRVLEILTYLARNQSLVANSLLYFEPASSLVAESGPKKLPDKINQKGKTKLCDADMSSVASDRKSVGGEVPLSLLLKLLNQPLYLRSNTHLEQVMGLLEVVTSNAASMVESERGSPDNVAPPINNVDLEDRHDDGRSSEPSTPLPSELPDGVSGGLSSTRMEIGRSASGGTDEGSCPKGVTEASKSGFEQTVDAASVILGLATQDLCHLCLLLACEGLSEVAYSRIAEILKKIAKVAPPHRRLFITELANAAKRLSGPGINELLLLGETETVVVSTASMVGGAILRVLLALSALILEYVSKEKDHGSSLEKEREESYALIHELNTSLEPLWQALSACVGKIEERLSSSSSATIFGVGEVGGSAGISSSLPTGAPRVLPYIEAFFVLSDKLKVITPSLGQSELSIATACETKEAAGSLPSSSEMVMMSRSSSLQSRKSDERGITFPKFAERHKRLLNAFLRQNPGLLEKSLSLLLRTPKLIDFDNKRAYFRAKIRQHHEQRHYAPLRISVRRAYVLEDSYNQLRMRTPDELKGRLTVQFQGEEGIDAGGLTREWYQLLSRVIFDKGALLFTTVGNDSTFQPNPNSVYQTEHLSYFRFVGRVVAKALFDGQLLDVYFTRSFYKHILGVKVTYHDIEAVDPDFYKNLKWVLENDISDILGLTFSMDADEEKHILYEKNEVMDYELIPGGRNIRVTEENKHEYVDLVAEHRLTTAIRPQINEFLEGFNELISKDLISIFNDKELELLISGLPEIDLDDLKANTEYTGYTVATPVVQWFWEVVRAFNQEDMARLLQFVTGTSKVPLEGFRALQGISGPQRFQIHKAYGAPDRLPSAHTCFNQLDLPEYSSKEQLEERLLLAIHEGSEGFGFG